MNRKTIRLKQYDYSQQGEYFITICTKDRKYIFGEIEGKKSNIINIWRNSRECIEKNKTK